MLERTSTIPPAERVAGSPGSPGRYSPRGCGAHGQMASPDARRRGHGAARVGRGRVLPLRVLRGLRPVTIHRPGRDHPALLSVAPGAPLAAPGARSGRRASAAVARARRDPRGRWTLPGTGRRDLRGRDRGPPARAPADRRHRRRGRRGVGGGAALVGRPRRDDRRELRRHHPAARRGPAAAEPPRDRALVGGAQPGDRAERGRLAGGVDLHGAGARLGRQRLDLADRRRRTPGTGRFSRRPYFSQRVDLHSQSGRPGGLPGFGGWC